MKLGNQQELTYSVCNAYNPIEKPSNYVIFHHSLNFSAITEMIRVSLSLRQDSSLTIFSGCMYECKDAF